MYTLLKSGGSGYFFDEDGVYNEYICDTAGDINLLPTGKEEKAFETKPRPGSTAVVIATATVYILSNTREWKLLIPGG